MSMTYHTLSHLTIKGLCIVIRNSANHRDRLNAAEMLHSRVVESVLGNGLPDHEKRAIKATLAACGAADSEDWAASYLNYDPATPAEYR